MELYLIRHANAVDSPDDFSRALSSRGRGQIESLVRFFRANELLQPEELWHSPLLRARETAQRLGAGLGWRMPFRETNLLEPERDPQAVVKQLKAVSRPLALVAHEPLLSALATLLVRGAPWPVVFTLRTADILALEPAGADHPGRWAEKWHRGSDGAGRDE
jgi:phosphohistidine phosphatase